MPIGTARPEFHALFCFPPLQCLLSWTHGRHVDWIVPSLVTICHLETHLSKKPTSSYYQTVFSCKETQSRPRMGRVSHWTVSYGRRPLRFGLFDSSRNFDLHLKQSRPPCLSRSTSLRPWHGKLQKIDLTKKRPFTDLQQVETPSLEHPRAIEHSHSNRHHGYQIEDIEIHIWQQNTPTSRIPATGFTMNNLDSNIPLHDKQGIRVALGLAIITIQQPFHHYQIDTVLTTDAHRRNNLTAQRPRPFCDHLHFSNMDPYTSNEVTCLGSVCNCFTDVGLAYWQCFSA